MNKMILLPVLTTLAVTLCHAAPRYVKEKVSAEQLSFQAGLYHSNLMTKYNFQCVATIIAPCWAIIVAHCIDHPKHPKSYTLIPLSFLQHKHDYARQVSDFVINHRYSKKLMNHDIALVKTKKCFHLNDKIRSLPLPAHALDYPKIDDEVKFFTYDSYQSKHKKFAHVVTTNIYDSSNCAAYNIENLSEEMYCGGKVLPLYKEVYVFKNTGGPVVFKNHLVGLVLSVMGERRAPLAPEILNSLFLSIQPYIQWISSTLDNYKS